MANWFHKFLNPHCVHCMNEKNCANCDTLRTLLEAERDNNKQLLGHIVAPKVITKEIPVQTSNNKQVPRYLPWRAEQQRLEEADRASAEALRRNKQSTEEIEKSLGIDEVKNG